MKMWDRLKCEQCGLEFSSTDPNAFVCQRCEAIHAAALNQTKDMPAPAPEDRQWSKAAMRERLGVNGDVDE